jgi:hypothetical protein
MNVATFLPVYFARLDAGEDIVPMFAADFTFSFLWATGGEAREFAGSFEEFAGYMAQREPDGQLHHINLSLRNGKAEVVTGWTTRFDVPLGTFTFAVEVDDDERARRLFAARTDSFGGLTF